METTIFVKYPIFRKAQPFFFRVLQIITIRTTARTNQTTWKGLRIRYFDWPIPVFIRFTRATYEFTEYIRCKIINGSYIWYGVVRCGHLDKPRFREHFLGSNYSDTHTLLISIEKLSNEDSFRKAREAHIIYKAKTLEPLGINKHDQL